MAVKSAFVCPPPPLDIGRLGRAESGDSQEQSGWKYSKEGKQVAAAVIFKVTEYSKGKGKGKGQEIFKK